ncbi:MAG: L-lactate permease [Coriobacteriales bacterium]|jgi:lactate permease|nr:L-lactate permease [Coriobacteriales bacterium]
MVDVQQGFTVLDVVLTLVPVVLVFVLMAAFKIAGDISGVIGWIAVVAVAVLFFSTPLEVALLASWKGVLASMAITGMTIFAILQITFIQETGALKRIVTTIKTIAKKDKVAQIMILNVCIGTILVSVGATPVTILPPILLAMGYTTVLAIALPALGFDALCTYAMLGVSVVVMSDILTGAGFTIDGQAPTVQTVSMFFARYLPFVTPCICAAMTLMVGGPRLLAKGIVPILITGLSLGLTAMAVAYIGIGVVLTGVIAGVVGLACMLLYLKARRMPLFDRSDLTAEDLSTEKSMPLWKALSPWGLLIVFCLLTNFVGPLYDFLYKSLEMRVFVFPGDAGQPMRILWNAYFWVLVSTLLATFIIRPQKGTWSRVVKKWGKRFYRPTIASLAFFMLAYVMMYSANVPSPESGVWGQPDPSRNMIYIWAMTAADAFSWAYPIANSFLGLISGFVTGSEASTIALFAKYNLISSDVLGLNPLYVIAGGGIGAGLASVITPVKLQQASATIDRVGEESMVLRKVFGYAVCLVAVSAALTMIFCTIG